MKGKGISGMGGQEVVLSLDHSLKLAWKGEEKEGSNHLGKPNLLLRLCYRFVSLMSPVRDDILVGRHEPP